MTWTLQGGLHMHYCGGMSKNSKGDLVSKKNIYTQQILYDHLNLAEGTGLLTNLFFHSWATQRGPSMPATSVGFHTLRGVSRASTHRIHASYQAGLDLSTHPLLYAREQPLPQSYGRVREGEGLVSPLARLGRCPRASRLTGCVRDRDDYQLSYTHYL